jgi:hypothetical protein
MGACASPLGLGLWACQVAGWQVQRATPVRLFVHPVSCPSLETEVPWRPKRRREQVLVRAAHRAPGREKELDTAAAKSSLPKNTTGVQPGTKWSRAHFPVRVRRRRRRLRSGHGDADSCTKSYPLVLVDHSSVVTLARNSMDSEEWSPHASEPRPV